MIDKKSIAGKNIVNICSRLMPSETATIVTDKETIEIGELIKNFAENITQSIYFHTLEDYAKRPLNFIPKKIKNDVRQSDVLYFAAQSKPGELQQFRRPLIQFAISKGREIHMPNINNEIINTGMQADFFKIASLTFSIMSFATNSITARVETPAGTDLKASFSRKLRWVPDTGLLWFRGMWGNLPAGEVFTCPENIEGIIVVDGTLGDFFNEKYGDLSENPVSIPVRNSRADVEKIECENHELLSEFQEYLQHDENANRIGEFACGTNISLNHLIGNLLQDEKFPGVHIAFGSPYPNLTGANWNSNGHVDGIMKKCSLWFDETQIIDNGKFIEKVLLSLD